ncbi:hypothetical protein [Bdellovibrio sp. HCB2-146]|uniref:hypothetical protein n=1 Tax=Bdellovibrio sp. HCB2-146 TaxID=3394362 RepID=UPI0039BD58FB
MKHLILILTFLFCSSITFAGFKTANEAQSKLKTFQTKSFDLKDEKSIEKMEDDLVDSLIDAVEFATKGPLNAELTREIVRVALVLLKQDKTNYGAEIILPLYKKNESEMRAILKTLPKEDSQLLEKSLKGASDEASGVEN